MDLRLLVFPAVIGIALLAWNSYLGVLKTNGGAKQKITLVFLSVMLLFSVGFAMRLGGAAEIIDLGFYLTDFSFLMAYLLIAVAALLGQAKYHS
ncbi:MAG TPA: hypothetical protein PKJ97_03410 [Candidatus Bilamarchaeaceae archaeon]|nr:hypothetical protein [Candidatus Bilamarchaeaceae archaeon]